MLQLNHYIPDCDTVYQRRRDENKMSDIELRELASMLNVNTCDECDEWLDEEIPVGFVEVIDEDEFFQRYFGEQL